MSTETVSAEADSKPNLHPVRPTASNSTIKAIAAPLWPPNGSCAPASPASGSVVGLPSGSIAQPSGMVFPSRRWIWISPRAEALDGDGEPRVTQNVDLKV